MEDKVTALEMRRKFGGILDRVVEKGDHITIMRGNQPLASIIPAKEHNSQCSEKERVKTVDEVLAEIEEWQRRNARRLRKIKKSSTEIIREMRDTRWSSLTRR